MGFLDRFKGKTEEEKRQEALIKNAKMMADEKRKQDYNRMVAQERAKQIAVLEREQARQQAKSEAGVYVKKQYGGASNRKEQLMRYAKQGHEIASGMASGFDMSPMGFGNQRRSGKSKRNEPIPSLVADVWGMSPRKKKKKSTGRTITIKLDSGTHRKRRRPVRRRQQGFDWL